METDTTALVRTDLVVDGMSCAACASRIQRKLSELDSVSDTQVNFAAGRAVIRHNSSASEEEFSATIEALGYRVIDSEAVDQAKARSENDLKKRLLFAVVLTVPVVALSMLPGLSFAGWEWLAAALTTPVVFYAGWVFHRAAWLNLIQGSTTMDTLVSMGSFAALLWSLAVLFFDFENTGVYFETAAVIITLILAGKWLESRAKRRSGDAIKALSQLQVSTVDLQDGSTIEIEDLAVGMCFIARPGQRLASDGVVVEGESALDVSMITGEPLPVDVSVGAEVIGASINLSGVLVVKATRVGADTALAQIMNLVDQAQGSRAAVQRLADRVAAVFVPTAIATALLSLAVWLLSGQPSADSFSAAVAVLIIACPCALGLATPLAIMVGTGRGAQLGVIIKGGEVLEDTRRIDTIVLDKTGTVTQGSMSLKELRSPDLDGSAQTRLHAMAAAVESGSSHPIAAAIAGSVSPVGTVTGFTERPGYGVSAQVDGIDLREGRASLFDHVSEEILAMAGNAESNGASTVLAGRDGTAEMVLVISDQIKASSKSAIEAFTNQGLNVVMLTGDNQASADWVAAQVGVDEVIAGVYPAEKAAEIARLQQDQRRVAMVGDGINDAPALAQADLGIAIGTGTDVAIEASDLTVVSGDLLAVADAIALSRRTLTTIKGNLFWAFAYNAAAIPLAAIGVLNPMIAAAAMGLSSLFVISNSLRLRSFSGYRRGSNKVSKK